MNLIGIRSACASSRSVAVDHSAPVMCSATIPWTLVSLFTVLTEPRAIWSGLLWCIGVYQMSTA